MPARGGGLSRIPPFTFRVRTFVLADQATRRQFIISGRLITPKSGNPDLARQRVVGPPILIASAVAFIGSVVNHQRNVPGTGMLRRW